MVILEFLIGVLGTPGLDDVFNRLFLFCRGVIGVGVDRHGLGSGERCLHLDELAVGEGGIEGVLQRVERLNLTPLEVVLNGSQNQLLETGLLDHTGNETGGLFLTHHVLYADTVFDILVDNLTAERRFRVAVHGLLRAVIGKGNDQLREQLSLGVIRCLIVVSRDIPRIGEQDLAAGQVFVCYLTGEFLEPDLVTVLLLYQDHISQLVFGAGIRSGGIFDDRITVFIYLIFPCSGNGLNGSGHDSAEGHHQGQDSGCNSFHIHCILSFPPVISDNLSRR